MADPRSSMDQAQYNTTETYHTTPYSATSSNAASSPCISVFSHSHKPSRSGGSSSSLASSPITSDSFDLWGPGPAKRLEDVTEEPQERDETWQRMSTGSVNWGRLEESTRRSIADDVPMSDDRMAPPRLSFEPSLRGSPPDSDYSFSEHETWSTSLPKQRQNKRQRSAEYPVGTRTSKLLHHFPSLSKRWKHKSGVNPQLSIITSQDRAISRTSSGTSSHVISPALSAISKHESHLPSPVRTTFHDRLSDSPGPIDIMNTPGNREEEQPQATTPLLPPVFSELSKRSSPIQSPLQSPTIAAAPAFPPASSPTPTSTPQLSSLPSPPLSTKPSIASMPGRSRANTATAPISQIPALSMLDEQKEDIWAKKLGHADFSIYPEPYTPETLDIDSFEELRANHDMARSNYEKHRAETGENYGPTSKIYSLTQEKWNHIDAEWEKEIQRMTSFLRPNVALGPALDVVEDTSGKFPKLGDNGIVGTMSVIPARVPSMKKQPAQTTSVVVDPATPISPSSARKRSFLKFISDVLGRGSGIRS
jgi:hypothetical protein